MLTATNSPRVLGARFSASGPTPIIPATRSPEFRSTSKRIGVLGLLGLVA
jgi:hypothetical protein